MASEVPASETLPHIKRVSRIKHAILQKYLPSWAIILGSANRCMNYFDCFAGPGRYEFEGLAVDGSPVIAVKAAKTFLETRPNHSLYILLTENDEQQARQLEQQLEPLKPYPKNLNVEPLMEDSKTFIPELLSKIPSLAPSFFMIDPYGHPLTLPVINNILARQRTEALITLMWYRVNMDLEQSCSTSKCGPLIWRSRMATTAVHETERDCPRGRISRLLCFEAKGEIRPALQDWLRPRGQD